jgi:PTH1 family peptidyl-tRNA hydrolase
MASAGTGDFGRVRIGVGRPPPGFRGEVADYVLSGFDAFERASLPDVLAKVVDSLVDIPRRGFDAVMNARNTRPKPKKPKPAPADPAQAGAGAAVSPSPSPSSPSPSSPSPSSPSPSSPSPSPSGARRPPGLKAEPGA